MYFYRDPRAKKLTILLTVALSVYFSIPGHSQALTMPIYQRLQPLDATIDMPTSVAIDSMERIYVTEADYDRLTVYSPSGDFIKNLSGLQRPIGVAVDNNGRIFVGNKGAKNVETYDFDLNLLFKLGSGDGEVKRPCAITTDTGGKIYVADCGEDKIKVYNSDGTFNFSFGSPGAGNGQFNFPSSIAIDKLKGEIIVSDHPVSPFGGYQGARIQIFYMNGGFKRSFTKKGGMMGPTTGANKLIKPMGVAIDEAGRIYVSDAYQNVVAVFDGNSGTGFGQYLGTVYDLNNPMRTPLGMALGKSNRLLITSQNSSSIDIYGLDTFTQMEVTPLTLTYNAEEGGADPALQSINITNNGNADLNWTASSADNWITLSAGSGTTAVGATSAVDIGIVTAGLTAGTYAGTVEVVSDAGVMETVNITLKVTVPPPILSVTPPSLLFTSINGVTPSSQALTVNNTGGGTLDWNATTDSGWILLDKAYGTAPYTINVSVDIKSIFGIYITNSARTFNGAVTVSINGTTDSVVIPVRLDILIEQGTINVTTNLTEATFIINGPQPYSGSGTSWTVADAPAGTYIIIYGEVAGYITPPSETQILQADGTISFNGAYEAEWHPPVKKNIIVGAGPNENTKGIVRVFNADGTVMELEFVAGTYRYGVNVASGDMDGDGVFEIITGAGPGSMNPAEVNIYDKNGNYITGIIANSNSYGVNVASADLDGDRRYEVITGTGTDNGGSDGDKRELGSAGAGMRNHEEVKVFIFEELTQSLVESGISLPAYKGKFGVKMTAGDLDGDGLPEIITVSGIIENYTDTEGSRDYDVATVIKIWKLDTSQGHGHWRADLYKEFKLPGDKARVSIAAGDINGDGIDEIIAGVEARKNDIKIYDSDGTLISEFATGFSFSRAGYNMPEGSGLNVASGDMDGDGVYEIVAGVGQPKSNRSDVKVFDAFGNEIADFKAMNSNVGANVAVGDLGY